MEPKKRELTQKIPQKNTLPNDDKSTINMSSMSATMLENMMQDSNNQNGIPSSNALQ
jgi:hypothetical protein